MVSLKCAASFSLLSKNSRIIFNSLRCTQSSSQTSEIEETSASESSPNILSVPTFFKRELQYQELYNKNLTPPREAWLLNFDTIENRKLNLIELHPSIFGAFPRLDLIHLNYVWQRKYKTVNWLNMRTRAELPGSNKKPWPQKGTGRARHGSTTAPQWIHGGWSHGPRGPKLNYYMLPFFTRVRGLIACLTSKFAQNDLKIVDTLEKFPSDDPKFLSEFMDKREWGPSVLIVDKSDVFPRNIALASEPINHINLMPVYGLNVHSMIKHETLVLTMEALEDIERKLLYQLVRTDLNDVQVRHHNPRLPQYPKVF